jgi:CDP-diacylglycerol pyrophosphatase
MAQQQRDKRADQSRRPYAVFAVILAVCFVPLPLFSKAAASCNEDASGPRHTLKHTCPADSHPDILLKIAASCAKNLKANNGCRGRSPRRDYVILKDNSPCKPKAYLLIPAQCVTGVEDNQVLTAPVVDFWRAAWIWSRKELPGVSVSRLGVAVNSLAARGNDQLHFHLSCVDRRVSRTLQRNAARIPEYSANVTPLHIKVGARNNSYEVVQVRGLAGNNSPFAIVNAMHGGEQSAMARQGIAVVAAKRKGEYYVLNTSEDEGGGHAEEILDQSCR